MTTAAAFDAGVRLRAASVGRPQPRMTCTPVVASGPLLAVRMDRRGRVRAAYGFGDERRGAKPADLGPLPDPADLDDHPPTLVVADRQTLRSLTGAAHRAEPDTADFRRAALVDWWAQRAEHPGSGAVIITVDACRARWMLGVSPDEEDSLRVWLDWLKVDDRGCAALLTVAALLIDGPALPVDLPQAAGDAAAWEGLRRRLDGGWDWRVPDGAAAAALGLQSRSDAADAYARALMDDPTWSRRERHTGQVVVGVLTDVDPRSGQVVLTVEQAACRHRDGASAHLTVTTPDGQVSADATVVKVSVGDDGCPTVTLTFRPSDENPLPPVGSPATLRPARVMPHQARRRLANLAAKFETPTWLTRSDVAPPAVRRDVPTDVVIAAADTSPRGNVG